MIWSLIGNRYVFIIGIVCAILSGAYIFYSYTTNKIQRLESDITLLQTNLDTQIENAKRIKVETEQVIGYHKNIIDKTNALVQENEKKYETLYRENFKKKSLEELAINKTQIINKLVNDATKKQFDCFENISRNIKCIN